MQQSVGGPIQNTSPNYEERCQERGTLVIIKHKDYSKYELGLIIRKNLIHQLFVNNGNLSPTDDA